MAIRCTGCNYENDPTRVYCHNCGVKLERGGSAPPAPTGFTHPTDALKMKRPRTPVAWGKYFSFFFKFTIVAVLAAVVILALLPPRDVPPPAMPDQKLAQRWSGLISDAASADSARSFAVPALDVQRWLATVVQFQHPESPWNLDPKRIYASQGDGVIRVGIEASLFKVTDLYFQGDYAPVPAGAGYTFKPVGYSIGRLPLPLFFAWPVERQLFGLGDALAVPLSQLAKASRIDVTPQEITLRWAGTQSP